MEKIKRGEEDQDLEREWELRREEDRLLDK
jgi:hypothetical protein